MKAGGSPIGTFTRSSGSGPLNEDIGRWPANVVLDEAAAALLDEQTGELSSHDSTGIWNGAAKTKPQQVAYGAFDAIAKDHRLPGRADSGGASRFFYVAKPSRAERDYGLDGIEIVTVKWSAWEEEDQQVKLRVDTGQYPPRVIDASGTLHSYASEWNTFLFGSSSTAQSLTDTRSIIATETRSTTGSKTLSWLVRSLTSAGTPVANGAKANGGSRVESAGRSIPSLTITSAKTGSPLGVGPAPSATRLQINGNAGSPASHPTVKPVELMRWLVKLVTPPDGTVLDPFAGSGTTGMACRYEHRQFIGIEREAEYVAIAEARIAAVAPLFG